MRLLGYDDPALPELMPVSRDRMSETYADLELPGYFSEWDDDPTTARAAQQRLSKFEGDVRHLRFAVEIQHQIVRQSSSERATGFEKFAEGQIEIGIAFKALA